IERLLKRRERLHHRLRMRVFGFQVLDHLRIGSVAEPEVVVRERAAVDGDRARPFLGNGRIHASSRNLYHLCNWSSNRFGSAAIATSAIFSAIAMPGRPS